MEMFLQLFQYWLAVERDKLLTANLCERQVTKNYRVCLL